MTRFSEHYFLSDVELTGNIQTINQVPHVLPIAVPKYSKVTTDQSSVSLAATKNPATSRP